MSALSKSGLVLSHKLLCIFILNLVLETTHFQLQGENKTYNSGAIREILRFFLHSVKNIKYENAIASITVMFPILWYTVTNLAFSFYTLI